MCCAGPAAQLVAFKCFGGIVNLDPIGARHALALTVVAARKVLSALCQKTVLSRVQFYGKKLHALCFSFSLWAYVVRCGLEEGSLSHQ